LAGGGFATIIVVVVLVIICCVWRYHKAHSVYYRGIEGPTFGRCKLLPDHVKRMRIHKKVYIHVASMHLICGKDEEVENHVEL